MHTMTATHKFIATIVVLAVLGGGLYWWQSDMLNSTGTPNTNSTTTPNGATTTTPNGQGQAIQLDQPDYKKPIAFSSNLTAEFKQQLNTKLAATQQEIATNPLNIFAWVELGTIHKMGGSYKAAEEYWLYVAEVYEGPATPYYSLGDLYENFLKDTAKAEAAYKNAIRVDEKNVNAYASLYTMYHYTLKDDVKAAAILQQGLTANPGNNYLLGLQAELN